MKTTPLLICILVVILVGIGAWFVSRSDDAETSTVVSFEDCVAGGYPVMESYPRRCAGPDGQTYVEDVDTDITYINASVDDIRVELPFPGAVVGKSFKVIGEARAWYFEGSFPIEVLDANGMQLATGIAQAQGEWMTTEFVPFEADITIPDTYIGPAMLVLRKDNPSDMREFDASAAFPITVEY